MYVHPYRIGLSDAPDSVPLARSQGRGTVEVFSKWVHREGLAKQLIALLAKLRRSYGGTPTDALNSDG